MEKYVINENRKRSKINFLRTVTAKNEAEAIKRAKAAFLIDWYKAHGILKASREIHKWNFRIYQPFN